MTTVFRLHTADGERRCTESCLCAEHPECTCICGGEFHGAGLRDGGIAAIGKRVAERLAEHPEELGPLFAHWRSSTMMRNEVFLGMRVRSLVDFAGVPKGTEGVVDEDYGSGITVAWDLPDRPLPAGYREYDGQPAIQTRILRDGFAKVNELHFLEPVR